MPSPPLLDIRTIDQGTVLHDLEEIRRFNPQRFEMEQLSGIYFMKPEDWTIAAYRDVRADEWWTRGHIPGRPLFPGVLMLEAAAQMASFLVKSALDEKRFLGFGGVEDVRFRGQVEPPGRLILVGKGVKFDRRVSTIAAQAFYNDKMVFEGKIIGVFL